jgi:hypothetical protein
MERLLLQEALKCRVVSSLSGDAHFLFPRKETSLAVRVYYPSDVKRLESLASPEQLDTLESFRDTFLHAVVMFILPDPQLMMEYLSKSDSFVQKSQRIMNDGETRGNAKTFLVPDTRSAMDCLLVMWDSLRPDRRQLRRMYYQEVRESHFVPSFPPGNTTDPTLIAKPVIQAFKNLASRLELADGVDDILIHQLQTLSRISSADYRVLDHLRIDSFSKQKLSEFFGSQLNSNQHGLIKDNRQDDFMNLDYSQSILEVSYPISDSIPDYSIEFHHAQDLGYARERSLDILDSCQLTNDVPNSHPSNQLRSYFDFDYPNSPATIEGNHQLYITPNTLESIQWQNMQHPSHHSTHYEHWNSPQIPDQFYNHSSQHSSVHPYEQRHITNYPPNRDDANHKLKGYAPGISNLGRYYA